MLGESDSIVLVEGVSVADGCVVDDVRARRLPVNSTASFVLARVGRPLGDVAAELAGAFGLEPAQAHDDVLAFAYRLNRLLLVNVDPGVGRAMRLWAWLQAALRLAPGNGVPLTAWRRVGLDTRSGIQAAVSTLVAVRSRAFFVALFASLLGVQLAALGGAVPGWTWVVVGAAVGLGLALHEAGHAAVLGGVPAALILAGPRTFVLHRTVPAARRRLVAAAGPTAPLAAGAIVAAAARPVESVVLAFGACALCGHAMGLTVATQDGRTACGV
jgi:hypothetical protein